MDNKLRLTEGVGGGLGGEQRGKNWDNCNRITIKHLIKKKEPLYLKAVSKKKIKTPLKISHM